MGKRFAGDIILIVLLLVFSWWLMGKSLGYDARSSQFRVARHEVGDTGLHMSLIRSFAWGDNAPAQSPFYPGKPLVYHYAVDWLAGQFVRSGVRIDYAVNGVSAIALTVLLYGLYRLGGIVSIALFLLPGNLSFIEFFKQAPKDLSFFSYLWRFPDYLHQGPFDGSMITIYTTLSPYLNQRHLIAGTAIGITVIWVIIGWIKSSKQVRDSRWILIGLVIGAATRVHVVVAAATGIVVIVLLLGKRRRALFLFAGAALLASLPHVLEIMSLRSDISAMQFYNPGYLVPKPLSVVPWVIFWINNLGVLVFLVPVAFRMADTPGRRLMLGAGMLFILANTVQISFRIEHNHTLINYATVISIPFIANLLMVWWKKCGFGWKFLALSMFLLATVSGIFNLMVVKNDYQLMVDDAPKNRFIQWAKTQTEPSSIFIARPALYDAVTLAGRKNYLGLEYYVSVMGYDYWGRRKQIDTWLANFNQSTIVEMKKQHLNYIAIPKDRKDFPYTVEEEKVKSLLPVVYLDETITLYEL